MPRDAPGCRVADRLSDAVTSPGSFAVGLTSLPLLQASQPDRKGCPLAQHAFAQDPGTINLTRAAKALARLAGPDELPLRWCPSIVMQRL